jgi:hypothetical protein
VSKTSDVRYGRRGGRFTGGQRAVDVLADLHRLRLRSIAIPHKPGDAPAWPDESIRLWRRLATEAREHVAAGRPIDDVMARAIEVDDTARKAGR